MTVLFITCQVYQNNRDPKLHTSNMSCVTVHHQYIQGKKYPSEK